jgi:hypothetical protein
VRTAISFEGLDQLAGEVLPERLALSLIAIPLLDNGSTSAAGAGDTGSTPPAGTSDAGSSSAAGSADAVSSSAAAGGSGGGERGTIVMSACQATSTPGTQGLLGALGLGTPPSSTLTCTPAVVAPR